MSKSSGTPNSSSKSSGGRSSKNMGPIKKLGV